MMVLMSVFAVAASLAAPWQPQGARPAAAQTLPGGTPAAEFPPANTTAFIQTSGPRGVIHHSNWYTVQGTNLGNRQDSFWIAVPCTLPPATRLGVELFDPESYRVNPLDLSQAIDEIRPGYSANNADADTTTFRLTGPQGQIVAAQDYPPLQATDARWVPFATINVGATGCGRYTLTAITDDDDENAWRLRVTPGDADGIRNSGDEVSLSAFETTFQHAGADITCQSFFFFVPVTKRIRLSNFDMDGNERIVYYPPRGAPLSGTVSGNALWNNGGQLANPKEGGSGGDILNNPPTGWWRAEFCVNNPFNQYIFEPEGTSFVFALPDYPHMQVGKDDGRRLVSPGDVLTYTIPYSNVGKGAAVSTMLTDTLPAELRFLSCSPQPCGQSSGNPQLITYTVGTVAAGGSGAVQLVARVRPEVVSGTLITNPVLLGYSDTFFNRYPEERASDTDLVRGPSLAPQPGLAISKQANIPVGTTLQANQLISYTIRLTNTGDTTLDVLPLEDVFSPTVLAFEQATPAPDLTQTGFLRWNDLTTSLGRDFGPGESLAIDSVFRVLEVTTATMAINTACARDPLDSLGNPLPTICSTATVTVPGPTAIRLAELQAAIQPAGGVRLGWRTSAETDNYAFQVYRGQSSQPEQAQLLSHDLIAGRGAGAQPGASYVYNDTTGTAADYYWLVDIDLAGRSTWHGPVQATAAPQSSSGIWLPVVVR